MKQSSAKGKEKTIRCAWCDFKGQTYDQLWEHQVKKHRKERRSADSTLSDLLEGYLREIRRP